MLERRNLRASIGPLVEPILGVEEFILGKGANGQIYITHTKFPRYVALLGEGNNFQGIVEVVWWDECPLDGTLDQLLERAIIAAKELALYSEQETRQEIGTALLLAEEQFTIERHNYRDSEERLEEQAHELVSLAEMQQENINQRIEAEKALRLSEEQLQIQIFELIDSEERMALQAQEMVELAEDLQAAEQEMKFLANHDALTKLPSRRLCVARLEKAMADDRAHGTKTALLFIDLDGFKAVNDTVGHEAGDIVLVGVADRIRVLIGMADTAARIGGDEFILLIRDIRTRDQVALLAQKIIDSLSRPFDIDGKSIKIGASIGIAFSPDDGVSPELLLKNADQSMYVIKNQGKNNFGFFSGEIG